MTEALARTVAGVSFSDCVIHILSFLVQNPQDGANHPSLEGVTTLGWSPHSRERYPSGHLLFIELPEKIIHSVCGGHNGGRPVPLVERPVYQVRVLSIHAKSDVLEFVVDRPRRQWGPRCFSICPCNASSIREGGTIASPMLLSQV